MLRQRPRVTWLVGRDGSGNRSLCRQEPGQWVSHRLPGPGELAFVDQPNGVRASDVMMGRVLALADFSAWQAAPSPDGGSMVAGSDTRISACSSSPVVVSPGGPLCGQRLPPLSATEGGPSPAPVGGSLVYASQHTHPHPSLADCYLGPNRSQFATGVDEQVPGLASISEVRLWLLGSGKIMPDISSSARGLVDFRAVPL